MSDIVVEPCGAGWTVRHPRILFERFQDRSSAVRRARRLRSVLDQSGEAEIRLRLRARSGAAELLAP
jgi:hypothetical protein